MGFAIFSNKTIANSLRVTDHINQQVDTATFRTTEKPTVGKEVIITKDGDIIFGGVIVSVQSSTRSLKNIYDVECKDFTHYLDRRLVNKRYTNETINDIIADLLSEYAPEFTDNNVNCDIELDTITFNRIPVSDCIQQLAELVGFSWYVDYEKDIHFFAENEEPAPFSLTVNGGNHVWDSLVVTEDISQIRNQVYVIGGREEIATRTESYVADGEQRQFPLAYVYSREPIIRLNGTPLEVGLDNIAQENEADVFWNFEPSYIRFKSDNFPDVDDVVDIEGNPLKKVLVKVPNTTSIRANGVYEFKIEDPTITSRADAIERARVELQGYANGIVEGSFETYKSGLRSGQVISIDVPSIQGDYIIQSVSLAMRGEDAPLYQVKLASVKTLGIVRFLQRLLKSREVVLEGETLTEILNFDDAMEVNDSLDAEARQTTGPYTWADGTNDATWNFATWQ
jgi:hypothetical protein